MHLREFQEFLQKANAGLFVQAYAQGIESFLQFY